MDVNLEHCRIGVLFVRQHTELAYVYLHFSEEMSKQLRVRDSAGRGQF